MKVFTDFNTEKRRLSNDVHEQCFKDKELFDFSGYDKNSVCFNDMIRIVFILMIVIRKN